eukprot:Skav235170  [mRNA]  locus=scaffold721:163049:166700:- [translate_table: standard]
MVAMDERLDQMLAHLDGLQPQENADTLTAEHDAVETCFDNEILAVMRNQRPVLIALLSLSAGLQDEKESISVSSLGLIRSEVGSNSHRYKSFSKRLKESKLQDDMNEMQSLLRDPTKCNIFSLWEKPPHMEQQPLFERLVLEAWRRHSNGLCNEPILVTDNNVREIIPDIPEELLILDQS